MSGQTSKISQYLSLVRFPHTLFALPFAFIGFFMASTDPRYRFKPLLLLLVLLCMVFARNAAMSFNRYTDKEIDKLNPRTSKREIPAGVIRAKSALWFCIGNAILFIITTWFINSVCFFLSPVALLVILGYSFTKRFTSLSHLVLGLGLSLAPIGAYLSVAGRFDWLPLFISFCVIFWVGGFDIIYSIQDEEFDKSMNLKSIPAWLGKNGALTLSVYFHLISVICIIMAGFLRDSGMFYWSGVALFTILVIAQHLIVKPGDHRRTKVAFFDLNGVASLSFALFVIIDMVTKSI